ncbi:5-hydroxyisourate hydrolase-like protein [Hapsidospora chrysogenum ATCC 11550]|uniref:5-hydroxyisourate hydrolase n=1 Tax=Hapsidospora chrysogenum (strain ATCC 11550 / CBS 779.69 / DSM 880 / IAM 14645 / JCM 23072 / IMI 49137) TaxID=857340 RepID=A0A086T939_HAPC1|nr:5-hydroxyisourate hydrolase-like protein [Hapsidospora chrysogenum ATCC 11550]
MSGKDPITCHVLDTTAGRPAKGIRVRLQGPIQPSSTGGGAHVKTFESLTDDDGRVKVWLPYSSETSSGEVPVHTLVDVLANVRGPSRWTLRFDTEAYFGEGATFFPEATVVFRVEEGQTYHVPLLLSPYSYTTYRGS